MYRESLDSFERAVDLDQRPHTWYQLLESCSAFFNLLAETEQLPEAEEALRRSIRYADRLEGEARERGFGSWIHYAVEWRYRYRRKLAALLRQRGATAEADEHVREALALVQTEAHSPGITPDELSFFLRGVVCELTGPEELHVLAETLSRKSPGPAGVNGERHAEPEVRRQEAYLLHALAGTCEDDKRYPQAMEALREEVRVRQELAASFTPTPDDLRGLAVGQNSLAWLLATCADPKLRDPGRAVELAKKAVELAPNASDIWNTLGVALYRAGDWEAAIEALEKSERLTPDKYLTSNGFFLAMAHWQLGQKDEARAWYDRAVAWIDNHSLKNDGPLQLPRRGRGIDEGGAGEKTRLTLISDFGLQSGRWGPYRQASPSPARHRPGARSARRERCLSILSQTRER